MINKIAAKKVIGAKQTIKAIKNGSAVEVYIAKDAEHKITKPIVDLCQERNISIVYYNSMAELGKACSIDVGAATVCITNN